MGDEWQQSQDRSIEVEVADEQEYVTFRRLIKLCYGSTFIKEGDRDLDFSELVRLIHVANAFECMDALRECVAALDCQELDWDRAAPCIELVIMLVYWRLKSNLYDKAVGLLAKEVGPVHELFVPTEEYDDPDGLEGLRLSDKVKDLSPGAFQALLFSKDLQLKTMNGTFWLLLAWVEAKSEESEEGKQALFTGMAKHLHFDCMDPGYILVLVSKHPRIIAAGFESTALRACLARANMARRTEAEVETIDEVDYEYDICPLDEELRGGKVTSWTYDVRLSAAEAAAVELGGEYSMVVGLVAGLPWVVEVCGGAATEEEPLAVLNMRLRLPLDFFECCVQMEHSGFFFRYKLQVGLGTPHRKTFQKEDGERCWVGRYASDRPFTRDVVGPWGEVFGEGSEWLVDEELHARLTVETVNDQGPSVMTADV